MVKSNPVSTAPAERTAEPSTSEERVIASATPAPAPLHEGDVLSGKYRIEGVLGSGGVGVVYAAVHLDLETKVAVKVLRSDVAPDAVVVARLLREARASARIQGEHVARVLDVGALDTGAPYVVMELLTGQDLGAELRARGSLAVEVAVEYVLQACEAVAQAHAAGVVHRDLKPSNLFLTQRADGSPCVKVLDFGVAKAEGGDEATLTASGEAIGSPVYMSPEQIRSAKAVDARTDVWSLGFVFFELLTGERPFKGRSASARLAAIAADAPIALRSLRPEAPAELEAVILGCLEKDPEQRTPSVAALARALAPFAPPRALGLIARVEATLRAPAAAAPGRRRSRRALAAALAAVLAVGAGAYGVHVARTRADHARAAVYDPSKPRRAVAVVGLQNRSGRAESAWLSTAFAEMLGTELAVGERLRVLRGESVARAVRDLGEAGAGDAAQMRKRLGADVLVHGSYAVTGAGKVEVAVEIEGASRGGSPVSIAETGTEAELFDLVARVGARLRDALGVGALSAAEEGSARAARPANAEAARRYAEGLAKLRVYDERGAQASLEAAIAADPAFPLAHEALSEALGFAGHVDGAKAEAKRALDLSSGLSREERIRVEGRYHDAMKSWDEAISDYQSLFGFFPDDLEYGLMLAKTQQAGGKSKEAMATLEALHRLRAPDGEDPRIDVEEAGYAYESGDLKRVGEAAGRALRRAEARGARDLAARARGQLGNFHYRNGDRKQAQEDYEQARQGLAAVGDSDGELSVLNQLAILRADGGEPDAAEKLFEEGLSIARATGDLDNTTAFLSNLGSLAESRGQVAKARALYEEALGIAREQGHYQNQATTLGNIASTYRSEGDFARARRAYEERLAIARKIGADEDACAVANDIALVTFDQGDLVAAKLAFEETLALCRKRDDKPCAAVSLMGIGGVLFEQGDLAGAGQRFEEALGLRRQAGRKGASALSRLALGTLALERGDAAGAAALAREAQTGLHEAELVEEASAAALLLQALLAQGKRADAEAAAERAAPLLAAAHTPADRVPLELALARVQVASGKPASVEEGLKAAEAAVGEAKLARLRTALEARAALGEMEIKAGRPTGSARLGEVVADATRMGFVRIARRAARR